MSYGNILNHVQTMKMFSIAYRLLFYGIHFRLALAKRKLLLFQAQETSHEKRHFCHDPIKEKDTKCAC